MGGRPTNVNVTVAEGVFDVLCADGWPTTYAANAPPKIATMTSTAAMIVLRVRLGPVNNAAGPRVVEARRSARPAPASGNRRGDFWLVSGSIARTVVGTSSFDVS